MAVTGITGSTDASIYLKSTSDTSSTTSGSTTSTDNSTISMSDFYQILAAQLKNQSMYDSTDTSQYLTQMVQFTMLSQIQTLANSVDSSNALSMVGKTVNLSSTGTDGTTTTSSGTVDGVTFESGTPYITVNGEKYTLSKVTSVEDAS
jgi:flagellar basal-body rod modification protein FlgD